MDISPLGALYSLHFLKRLIRFIDCPPPVPLLPPQAGCFAGRNQFSINILMKCLPPQSPDSIKWQMGIHERGRGEENDNNKKEDKTTQSEKRRLRRDTKQWGSPEMQAKDKVEVVMKWTGVFLGLEVRTGCSFSLRPSGWWAAVGAGGAEGLTLG